MRPAAGSSPPSARRATAARRARAPPCAGTRTGCSAPARRPSRASPATGSTATPSSPRSRPSRAAGGVPTWLGAHAVPPESDDADAYLDFALAEVLPRAARARRGGGRLRRGRRVQRRAGAPLPDRLPRGRPGPPPARRPVQRARARRARDRARRALDRPPRGDRRERRPRARRERRHRRAAARRARSSSTGRCRPRERSPTPAPRSRSRPTSTPAAPSARACRSSARSPARSSTSRPAEALAACTVNAAHVLGLADRRGRIAPGQDADLVLLDAPDWRHLAYHLGGDLIAAVIRRGAVAWAR